MLLSYLFLIHSSLLFYSDPSLQWKLLALVTVLVLTAGVVLTGDWNYVNLWAGNTGEATGEYEGWLEMSREACLQRQDDGLWHCVSLGTGGVQLP